MADVIEKLERLAALLRDGILTQEQFEEQREILLAGSRRASAPPRLGSDPAVRSQVGAYTILGLIGQGGMGAVYRGRHRSASIAERQGGDVAIKVMHSQFARDPRFQARFEREAGLGVTLEHPGIVRVHELLVDAGELALVMGWVQGRSLATMIGREVGPIPWARAWPLFDQLLDAVEYAHSRGVVHRDLKPENVMVTPEGRLRILDFGIAKDLGGSGATATGVGMGTVDYMAPEQHTNAKHVDERADVYAIGMTMYEALAGRLPWGDDLDAVGVLHRKLEGAIPPPTDFYPHIPAPVVTGVLAALATDREGRVASVAALRTAVTRTGSPAAAQVALTDEQIRALTKTHRFAEVAQEHAEDPPLHRTAIGVAAPREWEEPTDEHERGLIEMEARRQLMDEAQRRAMETAQRLAEERRRRGSFGAAVPAPAAVLPPTTEALARAQAAGDEEQRLAGERRLWANIFIIGAALVGAALGVIAKDW